MWHSSVYESGPGSNFCCCRGTKMSHKFTPPHQRDPSVSIWQIRVYKCENGFKLCYPSIYEVVQILSFRLQSFNEIPLKILHFLENLGYLGMVNSSGSCIKHGAAPPQQFLRGPCAGWRARACALKTPAHDQKLPAR